MDTPLVITIPTGDKALQAQLEEVLKPYGQVYLDPTESLGLDELRLFFEVLKDGFGAVGTLAGVVYLIKDRVNQEKLKKIKVGEPGEDGKPVAALEGHKPA